MSGIKSQNKQVTMKSEAYCKTSETFSGTGAKSFQPDVIAECLFDAVEEYTSKSSKPYVKDIKLVIYYQNSTIKPRIMTALQSKVTAGNNQSGARKFFRKAGGKSSLYHDQNSRQLAQLVTHPA